jgi:hypothetical protein
MKEIIIFLTLLYMFLIAGCFSEKQENVNVTVSVSNGGIIYKEVVTSVNFDNKELGTSGEYSFECSPGTKTLIYSWGNINGYGMILNPKTERINVNIEKDTKILIYGSKIYF